MRYSQNCNGHITSTCVATLCGFADQRAQAIAPYWGSLVILPTRNATSTSTEYLYVVYIWYSIQWCRNGGVLLELLPPLKYCYAGFCSPHVWIFGYCIVLCAYRTLNWKSNERLASPILKQLLLLHTNGLQKMHNVALRFLTTDGCYICVNYATSKYVVSSHCLIYCSYMCVYKKDRGGSKHQQM